MTIEVSELLGLLSTCCITYTHNLLRFSKGVYTKPIDNLKGAEMTVEELEKKASLYKVAQVLNLTAPAVYKWRKKNVIPDLRLYQLREKKPEWFSDLTPA